MMHVQFLLLTLTACTTENNQVEAEIPQEEQEIISMRIDFGSEDGTEDWFALNDDVMGGVSVGETYLTDDTIVFDGFVSTRNNGGFVSLRSPIGQYDLSAYTDVVISYRAEGHDFNMVLADEVMWYLPTFEAKVISQSDEWTTSTVSLYDFTQYAMTGSGTSETGEEMSEDHLSEVIRIDLMNSTFADSDFVLEIDYIEFQGVVSED